MYSPKQAFIAYRKNTHRLLKFWDDYEKKSPVVKSWEIFLRKQKAWAWAADNARNALIGLLGIAPYTREDYHQLMQQYRGVYG